MLIRIKRDSVVKKPNAGRGNAQKVISVTKTIKFETRGELPVHLLNDERVCITERGNGYVSGLLINDDLIDEFLTIPGISISVEKDLQTVNTYPEPIWSRWLFEYENPLLECDHCHETIHADQIEWDYDDYGSSHSLCPKCEHYNTFGDIQYEPLNIVLMELNLV